ncbi:MAG: hypothetical protein Q9184_004326 [Pyrenodesmia sp. 2 TL-2023]
MSEKIVSKKSLLKRAWMQTYSEIEGVLVALLDYYGVKLERDYDPTGDAFALSVLEAFDNGENPLHGVLGTKRVGGHGSQEATVPIVRKAIDNMRQCRTWFRSQCFAKSDDLEIADPEHNFTYESYYVTVFQALVECLGTCLRDSLESECLASCKAMEASVEQGIARTNQTFTCEFDHCRRVLKTRRKLNKHLKGEHQSGSQVTICDPRGIKEPLEAGFTTDEFTHAKLLGMSVQESVDAKATASWLPISDQLSTRMREVPRSRTGALQQLQGPAVRASTGQYRIPPSTPGAKSRVASNAQRTTCRNDFEGNKAASLGRVSKAEHINHVTNQANKQSDSRNIAPPARGHETSKTTQLNQAIPKPHSAQLLQLESTKVSLSNEDVGVQSEHLAQPAGNSISMQEVPSDPALVRKSLFEEVRYIVIELARERDALQQKLVLASEEQAATVQKAKADLVDELRRGFNAVLDGIVRST